MRDNIEETPTPSHHSDGGDDREAGMEAARALADDRVQRFLADMAAAGNRGARLHGVGARRYRGWTLDFDRATGGCGATVVIGVDGLIRDRTDSYSVRDRGAPVGVWLSDVQTPIEPMYRALAFAYWLDRLRIANGLPAVDAEHTEVSNGAGA